MVPHPSRGATSGSNRPGALFGPRGQPIAIWPSDWDLTAEIGDRFLWGRLSGAFSNFDENTSFPIVF